MLEQIGEGKGYVDMSTVDAATSCKINEVFFLMACNSQVSFALFPVQACTVVSSVGWASCVCVLLNPEFLNWVLVSKS